MTTQRDLSTLHVRLSSQLSHPFGRCRDYVVEFRTSPHKAATKFLAFFFARSATHILEFQLEWNKERFSTNSRSMVTNVLRSKAVMRRSKPQENPTIQGLEQHSSSRAVQVRAQLGTTFIVERNAHSSKPRSGENP